MSEYTPDTGTLQLLSRALALKYGVLPLRVEDGRLVLLSTGGLTANDRADLAFVAGRFITEISAASAEISRLIDVHYPASELSMESVVREGQLFEQQARAEDLAEDAGAIIGQVDALISRAVRMRASDIHLEPTDEELVVRYRIDGVLQTMQPFSCSELAQIISRIKLMAGIDIAERRKPQDGRITMKNRNELLDIRVSSIPTRGTEKLVLRLLNKSAEVLGIDQLGMTRKQNAKFRKHLDKPQGMILVTGPTGSGKTTTLYAALSHLARPGVNIVTIEDPIEYEIRGITQSQVKPDIGYDFANALRAFLRQDPDILMVGEIRDLETAQVALRAAMTGHLVLSTIHTNDATSTVTRLVDIGLEPYLVSSSVSLIVAQRLMRKLCENCKAPDPDAEESLEQALGTKVELGGEVRKAGGGCANCSGTGYRGRVGIFELAELDRNSGQVSRQSHDLAATAIPATALTGSLRNSGIEAVSRGFTSVDEFLRVLAY